MRFTVTAALLAFLATTSAQGTTVTVVDEGSSLRIHVDLTEAAVEVARGEPFDIVDLDGGHLSADTPAGYPLLPEIPIALALPAGMTLGAAHAGTGEPERVAGSVVPRPAPDPDLPDEPAAPDPAIYSGWAPHPASVVRSVRTGWCRGLAVGTLAIAPLRYVGAARTLEVYRDIVVDVELVPEDPGLARLRRHPSRSWADDEATIEWLRRTVANPEAVDATRSRAGARTPSREVFGGFHPTERPSTDGSPVRYVIVTDDVALDGHSIGSLTAIFQELADWKTSKGMPAVVRTLSWVRATYPGHDDPDRLRNFLIDAYELWGTDYLLLGGDLSVVPARRFNGLNLGLGDAPADVYYGGLDNDWDLDDDGRYGERTRDAGASDPFWDLFVGRAPVETQAEAEVFVSKSLSYVRESGGPGAGGYDPTYYDRMLLMAGLGNCADWGRTCNGLFVAETIARRLVPPTMSRQRLYQQLWDSSASCSYHETYNELLGVPDESWTVSAAMGALNAGVGFVHHFEHSNPYLEGGASGGFGCSASMGGAIGREHVDLLTNAPNWSIVYSTGAGVNAYDYDSVSEHWILNPEGGAVAYIGKTRSGTTYVTGDADTLSFLSIFQNGTDMGQTLAFATQSLLFSVDRAVASFALLGDPELLPFTTSPTGINVSLTPPDPVVGDQTIRVTVSELGTGVMVDGARVALVSGDDVYACGRTASDGTVDLAVSLSAEAPLTVTATARNHVPTRKVFQVGASSAPHVVYSLHEALDDSLAVANGDGIVDAGEVVEVVTTIRNEGADLTAGSVTIEPIGAVSFNVAIDGACDPSYVVIGRAGSAPGNCEPSFPTIEFAGVDPHGRPLRLAETSDPGLFLWRDGARWTVSSRGADDVSPPSTAVHGIVRVPGGVTDAEAGGLEAGDGWSLTTDGLEFDFSVDATADYDSLSFTAREDAWVVVGSDPVAVGTLLSDESASVSFLVHPLAESPDGHVPRLELAVVDGVGEPAGRSSFEMPIVAPVLTYVSQSVLADGETFTITPTVRNTGRGNADGVELRLVATAGAPTVVDSVLAIGSLVPGAEVEAAGGFVLNTADPSNVRYSVVASSARPDGTTLSRVHEEGDLIPPCAPTGLWVDLIGSHGARCKWQAPDGGCAPDLAGYHVYRRLAGEVEFVRVYAADADSTRSFTDGGLPANTMVEYVVTAVDSARNASSPSAAAANQTWLPELPGWPRQVDAGTFGSPTLVDLDDDGRHEVLVLGNALYGWHGDGTPLVPGSDGTVFRTPRPYDILDQPAIGAFSSTPAVADLDGDGVMEIVVSAWDDSLWVVHEDGEVLWGRECTAKYSSPALGDLDGDGDLEVVVGSHLPNVYAWHHDGSSVVGGGTGGLFAVLGDGAVYNYSTPALVDLDGDATTKEVVFTSHKGNVYAWRGDGASLWSRFTGASRPLSTPAFGDVDRDGVLEAVVAQGSSGVPDGGANQLLVLNAVTGQIEKSWSGATHIPGGLHSAGNIIHAPALADIDGNADLEILVGTEGDVPPLSEDGATVVIFDHDAATHRAICQDEMPESQLGMTGQDVNAQPIVAEMDGDATLEVLVGSNTFGLYLFDTAGACDAEDGWPLLLGGEIEGTPALGDIDGDGSLDVVVRGRDDWVHAFDFDVPYDPDTIHWGQYAHDPSHTSQHDTPPSTIGSPPGEVPPPTLRLDASTPNPSNDRATIRFGLPGRAHVRLRIYGVEGRLVRTLIDGVLDGGYAEAVWDGRDARGRRTPSGTYFCHLETGGEVVVRKLLILR